MNDFTKEELEELLISLSCRFSRQLGYESKEHLLFTHNLENKIQSMIDNYCEHEWAFYFSSDGSDVKCMKCEKKLDDNK